jgi:uncharacterized damage-inducible protein DinB
MKRVALENLHQLKDFLDRISPEEYSFGVDILSEGTIGQHMRHILEFYLLMLSGSESGTISYDKRERDPRIETDPEIARQIIEKIMGKIAETNQDKSLVFEADYTSDGSSENRITSSVYREIAYCVEHSIHHQALIKSALIRMKKNGLVDEYFGVAYSTIRYRKDQCAL